MDKRGLIPKRWAEDAEISPQTLYNFLNGRSQSLSQQTMEALAKTVKVEPGQLFQENAFGKFDKTVKVPVVGAVQAGVWVEAVAMPEGERFNVEVPISKGLAAKSFGLVVKGQSMNREYPDGTILVCLSLHDIDGLMVNGDHVIVERRALDGMIEATCKELVIDESDVAWLWPRSTDPKHQTPIEIPWPYIDGESGHEIVITSVVIGSYRPRIRRA